MEKDSDVFSEEYAAKSSTDAPSKTGEEEKKDETVAGKVFDKSKPYRITIRAKEIK